MGKSAEAFKIALERAIKEGKIAKIELHRATGINRPSIDGYLKGAVPDLDVLDKIAHALGTAPDQLIKPPDDSIPLAKRALVAEILKMDDAEIARLGDTIRMLIDSDRRFHKPEHGKKINQS